MADETIPMADNRTLQMDNRDSNRLVLAKKILETKKDKYEIDIDNRLGIGGESQVFLAKRASDDAQVVIKIYDAFSDDPQNRRNRKAILEFLNNNSDDYKKSHIMPLLDYGEIEMLDKESDDFFNRPIDIIPYCKEGDTWEKECGYKMLKEKVIPEVLLAINLLHSYNLVHRDIKPNNIYIYENQILLADFGTTSKIIDSEYLIRTQTRRGTPGYTAPEISDSYYVTASDYYSLGCTIATLYNKGKHVYQNLLDEKDVIGVNIAMKQNGLPLECPKEYADLQYLVDALIIRDEKNRAGYDAVDLWIKDSGSFISKWKNTIKQGFEIPSLNFNFEGTKCNTGSELTEAILKNWEAGKKYLYRGTIKSVFDQYDQTLANKAQDITENQETAKNQDLGLAKFLHYLNTADKPLCPIYWCGETYEHLSDISQAISTSKADEVKITAMIQSRFLSWKIKNCEPVNEDTIMALYEVEEVTKKYPPIGYYFLMYACAPDKTKYDQTPDDIFKELTKNSNDWYKEAKKIIKDDNTLAFLVYQGYKKDIFELKKNLTGKFITDEDISDLLILYRLFESICKDKLSVREHYLNYGPQSNYCFRQNHNLYSFKSTNVNELETLINLRKVNKEMSISDIFSAFLKYRRDQEEQRRLREEKRKKDQERINLENWEAQERKRWADQRREKEKREAKERRQEIMRMIPKILLSILYFAVITGLLIAVSRWSFLSLHGETIAIVLSVILGIAGAIVIGIKIADRTNGCLAVILGIIIGSVGGVVVGQIFINGLGSYRTWIGIDAILLILAMLIYRPIHSGLFYKPLPKLLGIAASIAIISILAGYNHSNLEGEIAFPNIITVIKEGISSIGESDFFNKRLVSITIPDDVTEIGESEYARKRLGSVDIPVSVTSIGDKAFMKNKLVKIEIPTGVTSIGEKAFADNLLTSIGIGENVTLGNDSFGSGFEDFYIGNDMDAGTYTRSDAKSSQWNVWHGNFRYENNSGNVSITGYNGTGGEVVIPSEINRKPVTAVGQVFRDKKLTSVTIPGSVTSIESGSFSENQLTSIVISNGVSSIGIGAFAGNPVTSVRIGSNLTLGGEGHNGVLGENTGFNGAYDNNESRAGTYTRPNTGSTTWTRR